MSPSVSRTDLRSRLADHLAWWGLRRFESDAAYFDWQRQALSPNDLTLLNRLIEEKRGAGPDAEPEVTFYDLAARSDVLPVLYSQRYDYYLAIGPAVAERLADARTVLDFGCGIGLLTTFYAWLYPDITFVGVDRSAASVAVARDRAVELGLRNLRLEQVDLSSAPLLGEYELVVCTQALLQAENDPGLPSMSWETFARSHDPAAQATFERRTGLAIRLNRLCQGLTPRGRMILFEKTRPLARRVPFQRALAARAFRLLESPRPIRYCLVEEVVDDGPFYVVTRAPLASGQPAGPGWDERPEQFAEEAIHRRRGDSAAKVWERLPGRLVLREKHWTDSSLGPVRAEWGTAAKWLDYLYLEVGGRAAGILVSSRLTGSEPVCGLGRALSDAGKSPAQLQAFLERTWPSSVSQEDSRQTPLFENHSTSAEGLWHGLPGKRTQQAETVGKSGGGLMHLELGVTGSLVYLYCATTYDQRQLVLFEQDRSRLLEAYFRELRQSWEESRQEGAGGVAHSPSP